MSVFEMLCFDLSFSKSGSKITATARSDCKNIDYFPPPAPENRINQIPTLDFHHVENMQQCKDQSRAVPPRAAASPRQLQKKNYKAAAAAASWSCRSWKLLELSGLQNIWQIPRLSGCSLVWVQIAAAFHPVQRPRWEALEQILIKQARKLGEAIAISETITYPQPGVSCRRCYRI